MLHKVIIKDNDLSDSSREILETFKEGLLLTRVVRSLDKVLSEKYLSETRKDLQEELASYTKGVNSKHSGQHFATTLVYPNKPMRLFNHGLGLAFNIEGMSCKRLCLTDARDDDGVLDKKIVPTFKTFTQFIDAIQKTKPDHTGYCNYNEVQAYLKSEKLIAIFASINKPSDSEKEQQVENIAAYLQALAIQKFLLKNFNLNLKICLFDQKNGKLFIATRNPSFETLKLFLNIVNQGNCPELGLASTDEQELVLANKIILSRLNMSMPTSDFRVMIKKSLARSLESEIKGKVESLNQVLGSNAFPSSHVYARYSQSNQAYQLIISHYSSAITFERINKMLETLDLDLVDQSLSNKSNKFYTVTFMNEGMKKKFINYLSYHEDMNLRDKAEQQYHHSYAVGC